jgi:hypothetical protein
MALRSVSGYSTDHTDHPDSPQDTGPLDKILFPRLDLYQTRLPQEYKLPPTVPSPFAGTLEASLDAILEFGSWYPELRGMTTALLQPVDRSTNWMTLCQTVQTVIIANGGRSSRRRYLLEEFLFLVTRTLLPEQIAENRKLIYRMYDAKRNLSTRVVLRYDTMREWTKRDNSHHLLVDSRPPYLPFPPPVPHYDPSYPRRRAFMPNILATLIAATDDYRTKKLGDCMRHHVTDLDQCLMLTNKVVEEWETVKLLMMIAQAVLHWQWLRENNEVMDDMNARKWEDLDAKADDNEWVRDVKGMKYAEA